MPFVCFCGCEPRKIVAPETKMDFRKADPTYVNFVPKTCVEAIDLFRRHRDMGLKSALYPECFVHCARQLPDKELDMFHRYIVQPTGDIAKGGEKPTAVDAQLEKERLHLLTEACRRDLAACKIEEMPTEAMSDVDTDPEPMSQDDEKNPESMSTEDYVRIIT